MRFRFFQRLTVLVALPLLAWATVARASLIVPDAHELQRGMLTRFYYDAVLQVASQGGMELATELMQRVYALNRHDINVVFGYGQLLEARPDPKPAIAFYESVQANFPGPEASSALSYRLSMLYSAMGDTPKAIETLEKAVVAAKGKAPATFYYDLGVFYAKLSRYEMTQKYSQEALDRAPDSAAAWNNLGYSLAKLGDYQAGYAAVKRSLALEADNPNAMDSLGYILYQQGRYAEAIAEYEKVVKLAPKLSESQLYLGRACEATQDWPRATAAYEAYLESAPASSEKNAVEKRLLELKAHSLMTPVVTQTSTIQAP